MLNRLPKWPPDFQELLDDLCLTTRDMKAVAKALGVSERTVWRWKATEAPRMALLSLWWLSRWGYSTWDAEMFNRTQLHKQLHDSLWREVTRLRSIRRLDDTVASGLVGRPRRAANEPDDQWPRPMALRAPPPWSERRQCKAPRITA